MLKVRGFLKIAGLLGFLGGLVFLEHCRPLRAEKESKPRRNARNLAVAAFAAATLHLAESPLLYPLAKKVQERRWGLLKWLRLPRALELVTGVLLLDYTHYIQHVLHHRVPLLWRFHAVHHVDLDLDASTALRFHFGEIAISVPYRVTQVLLIGVDPQSFLARHSSLRRTAESEFELVGRLDDLGCTARHTQFGSSATQNRDRSTWIRAAGPGDLAKDSHSTVSGRACGSRLSGSQPSYG
jgi:hypothetical protein